jgi:hypothetical protein
MLALGALAVFTQPSMADKVNVTCQADGSAPTIKASISEGSASKSEDISILSFLPQYFSLEDAVQNCQKTAQILQSLYSSGDANYLATDKLNAKPVVCAVGRRGIGCDHYSAEILFALDPTVNPSQALYEMLGSPFKQAQPPDIRTVSRIYTDIKPSWWPF